MKRVEFDALIQKAHILKKEKGYREALAVLEKAHLMAQAEGWEHLVTHVEMFKLAVEYRMLDEMIAQIPRMILAIFGSVTGIYPEGNVGSSRMGIFESGDKEINRW